MVLKSDGTLQQVAFTVSTKKISLTEIRKRELQRCEKLRIVHGYKDSHYDEMSDEDVNESHKKIGEFGKNVGQGLTSLEKKELLMKFEGTRHLMVWGDNSTILNHSHIMYIMLV